MTRFVILFWFGMVLVPDQALAAPPVPESEWTPDTHLWLARAFVAEAGWENERDHAAIAHVLARRWRRAVKRWPTLRFVDVIRRYCSALGNFKRTPTPRQTWIRSLAFDLNEPEGWPQRLSWERHTSLWKGAMRRAHQWYRGRLRDPCKGRAWHWGGTIDVPSGKMAAMDCGNTRNTFYTLVE